MAPEPCKGLSGACLLSITRSTLCYKICFQLQGLYLIPIFYAYLQLTSAQVPDMVRPLQCRCSKFWIYRKFVHTAFDLFDLGNRFSVFSWAWMLFIFQRTRYLSRSRGLWMCDRPNQYLKPIPWRCFNSSQVTQILWCPPDYACSNTFTGWVTASSQ